MLQQTQVDTVILYYNRWIEACPTIDDVAKLSLDQVLKLWEGLGYYSRCRNFYRAVNEVITQHRGDIPLDWRQFRSLPGVGDYTANAVLSIAFNKPYPAVDGNIKRISARILGLKNLTKFNMSRINHQLQQWIDTDRPGDFNQALMDLGSEICSYKNPKCEACPLINFCKAWSIGKPESYPAKKAKQRIPHIHVLAGLVWYKDRFLILRRPESKMLGGLWEFPSKITNSKNYEPETLKKIVQDQTGLSVEITGKVGSVKHVYSHFSMTFTVVNCLTKEPGDLQTDQTAEWITFSEIDQYPFPGVNKKIFNLLKEF